MAVRKRKRQKTGESRLDGKAALTFRRGGRCLARRKGRERRLRRPRGSVEGSEKEQEDRGVRGESIVRSARREEGLERNQRTACAD